jgi:hypothetical protein
MFKKIIFIRAHIRFIIVMHNYVPKQFMKTLLLLNSAKTIYAHFILLDIKNKK